MVLYAHGGTFPSGLSIAYRFDGRSWRDALCDAGFHFWGLDFHGFGYSDPYPDAGANTPLGRTAEIVRGQGDSMCTDAGAASLPHERDIRIPRATHLMHLEENRYALYRATEAFLTARGD